MKTQSGNRAYIDGANLHKGIEGLGWNLDYRRFRVWLSEKFGIDTAYLFIGLIPKNKKLYQKLQEVGYTLVFKEVVYDNDGKAKGNCDADLVLQATRDAYEEQFHRAILVTSDGDYASLAAFLLERDQLLSILSPSLPQKCSVLLKRTGAKITYLQEFRIQLQYQKEKAPNRDGTL